MAILLAKEPYVGLYRQVNGSEPSLQRLFVIALSLTDPINDGDWREVESPFTDYDDTIPPMRLLGSPGDTQATLLHASGKPTVVPIEEARHLEIAQVCYWENVIPRLEALHLRKGETAEP